MQLIIIPSENKIGVDGEFRAVDLSDMDQNIHAIQCDGANKGHIEYKTADMDAGREVKINSYAAYQTYVDRWAAAAEVEKPLEPIDQIIDPDTMIEDVMESNPLVRGLVAMIAEDKGGAPADVVTKIKELK